MTFRFNPGETFPDGVHRVIAEECRAIHDELRATGSEEIDAAIHSARKSMKRVRAVLRLVRAGVEKPAYLREIRAFRDLSRRLAPPRDAWVMIRTWDRLTKTWKRNSPVADPDLVERIRSLLTQRYLAARNDVVEERGEPKRVAARIRARSKRMMGWPLERLEDAHIFAGLRRQYKRTRRSMRRAIAEPSPENRHEWRKQVKYLWHQTELFAPCRPGVLDTCASELKQLSDLLGDDHDLVVLESLLHEEAASLMSEPDREAVNAALRRRQGRLCASAAKLGARLLKERPRDFAGATAHGWKEFSTNDAAGNADSARKGWMNN